MKISTRVECGIIALIDIAVNSENGRAVSIAGISARQGISAKYLEQILIALKQANLIRGQKGSKGGYVLSKEADKINFSEIINALDLTILCDSDPDRDEVQEGYKATVNNMLWDKINLYIQEYTEKIALADAAARCALTPVGEGEYMYYI